MKTLSSVEQQFILHWGEMGARWGVNRTVAQIHALLYLSPTPLAADDIVAALAVARSNVSTSLKELQGWGIVRLVHVMGDKRDYFEAQQDVWETFRRVLDERKKREVDPTLAMLRQCLEQAKSDRQIGEHTERKLRDLAGFFEATTAWYDQLRRWPASSLTRFVKLGDRVQKLLGLA